MLKKIAHRELTPEQMDCPLLAGHKHIAALSGLARINAISRTAAHVWHTIEREARSRGLREFSVLDIACGGGDVVAALARRAIRSRFDCHLTGWDISPRAVEFATKRNADRSNTSFAVQDVLTDLPSDKFDFVISTMFLHHLSWSNAALLLRNMNQLARASVVVDDLLRSRLGLLLAWTGCRLLSLSPVVHNDGPTSVRGAFDLGEIQRLSDEAGLLGARIRCHWPRRFQLWWPCDSLQIA